MTDEVWLQLNLNWRQEVVHLTPSVREVTIYVAPKSTHESRRITAPEPVRVCGSVC